MTTTATKPRGVIFSVERDSLLTGPDGIGRPPWDCRHIEKLLNGVRGRIIKLAGTVTAGKE